MKYLEQVERIASQIYDGGDPVWWEKLDLDGKRFYRRQARACIRNIKRAGYELVASKKVKKS